MQKTSFQYIVLFRDGYFRFMFLVRTLRVRTNFQGGYSAAHGQGALLPANTLVF